MLSSRLRLSHSKSEKDPLAVQSSFCGEAQFMTQNFAICCSCRQPKLERDIRSYTHSWVSIPKNDLKILLVLKFIDIQYAKWYIVSLTAYESSNWNLKQ